MKLKAKIKELKAELNLQDEDTVIIHVYGKSDDEITQVKNISEKDMKRDLISAQYGRGNQDIGFTHIMFVVK